MTPQPLPETQTDHEASCCGGSGAKAHKDRQTSCCGESGANAKPQSASATQPVDPVTPASDARPRGSSGCTCG